MKAKEYAARILAAASNHTVLLHTLDEVVVSTIEAALARKTDQAIMACVREGFTKWKSVVAQVLAAAPECPIDISYFPKYLASAHPVLYALAYENKVFLGYEMDEKDKAAAGVGRDLVEQKLLRDRLASLQNEAKRLGLPLTA